MASVAHIRFTASTPWNHQPGLWIITILSVVYAYLMLGARFVIRRRSHSADRILFAAYALGTCSHVLMFLALQKGVGIAPDHLSLGVKAQAATLAFASNIFVLLTTGCSSYSHLRILEGLAPGAKEQRACWLASCFCICSCIIASITVSAGCDPSRLGEAGPNTSCSLPVVRWSIACAFLVLNFAIPALLPIYQFRHLRADLSRKVRVFLIFGFPLINVPLTALALRLYFNFVRRGRDGTGIVAFLCCLQTILCWSLVCPTIPLGRPVALRFATHGPIIPGDVYGRKSRDSNSSPTILSRSTHNYRSRHRVRDEEIVLRPDACFYTASVSHDPQDDDDDFDDCPSSSKHTELVGIWKTVETEVASAYADDFDGESLILGNSR